MREEINLREIQNDRARESRSIRSTNCHLPHDECKCGRVHSRIQSYHSTHRHGMDSIGTPRGGPGAVVINDFKARGGGGKHVFMKTFYML